MKIREKFRRYNIFGILNLLLNLIGTKLFYWKARIIRFPIEVRGKSFIDFGEGLTTGIGCRIEAISCSSKGKLIKFGKFVQINDYVHIGAIEKIIIGNNVLIASRVFITDHNHGSYGGHEHTDPRIPPIQRDWNSKPVIINDNVWIGESVSIMPGVIIGEGAIIGANSVVTKNIPDFSIAVGVPAKVIKVFNFQVNKWESI